MLLGVRVKSALLFLPLNIHGAIVGVTGDREVGGSIPARVDVSLSKTLNPELLPVAVSTVYESNMKIVFEYIKKCYLDYYYY